MYEGKGEQSPRKKMNYERLAVNVVVILIFAYVCVTLVKQEITIRKYKSQIASIERNIKNEEAEIKGLRKRMESVGSLENIERIARERLKMVKPGEIMYIDSQGAK